MNQSVVDLSPFTDSLSVSVVPVPRDRSVADALAFADSASAGALPTQSAADLVVFADAATSPGPGVYSFEALPVTDAAEATVTKAGRDTLSLESSAHYSVARGLVPASDSLPLADSAGCYTELDRGYR